MNDQKLRINKRIAELEENIRRARILIDHGQLIEYWQRRIREMECEINNLRSGVVR